MQEEGKFKMSEGAHASKMKKPMLSGRTYDILKYNAQVVLPALGTLYFAVAQIWGLPNAEEVVGTIVAVDTFLGVLLAYSTNSYRKSDTQYDGELEIEETDKGPRIFSLKLYAQPETLEDKTEIRFKVPK